MRRSLVQVVVGTRLIPRNPSPGIFGRSALVLLSRQCGQTPPILESPGVDPERRRRSADLVFPGLTTASRYTAAVPWGVLLVLALAVPGVTAAGRQESGHLGPTSSDENARTCVWIDERAAESLPDVVHPNDSPADVAYRTDAGWSVRSLSRSMIPGCAAGPGGERLDFPRRAESSERLVESGRSGPSGPLHVLFCVWLI